MNFTFVIKNSSIATDIPFVVDSEQIFIHVTSLEAKSALDHSVSQFPIRNAKQFNFGFCSMVAVRTVLSGGPGTLRMHRILKISVQF